MSRDISPDVNVDGLNLRLDMTALFDFEQRAGITVSEFLSPIIDLVQETDFGALVGATDDDSEDVPEDSAGEKDAEKDDEGEGAEEKKNRVGLDLLNTVLSSGVIVVKNLLILVWAMAGGEDLEQEPREFGRCINWENRADIAAAILKAIKQGQPEKSDEDEEEEEAAGEDPTPRPELLTTGQ